MTIKPKQPKLTVELQQYVDFLLTIDLSKYREKYRLIKSVEEDLPNNVQILDSIYQYYWVERNLLPFEEFISKVIVDKNQELREYNRKRSGYSVLADPAFELFLEGWVARQYRTWVSILTQIQLGYLAASVFPDKKIIMSEELDRKGIDIRISGLIDIGVKKVTKRTDVTILSEESEGVTPIKYWVPSGEVLKNPKLKNGKGYKKAYLDFLNDGYLDHLENGFIIFNKKVFQSYI
jgi:hypothetical protein